MFAIALMKLIFVARNVFDAYLIISAVAGSVTISGAPSGRYSSVSKPAARSLAVPTTIRSGCMKSKTAVPSRRNSGFEATSNSTFDGKRRRMICSTKSREPTGTVLLFTITT